MDPKVNITETDPPSDGHLVRGYITKDVTMSCYVENKLEGLDVCLNPANTIHLPNVVSMLVQH